MPVILKNNAFSTLATGATASDTGIVVANGSQFPTITAGEYFYATLVSQAGTTEIIKVTARVGNSMTVVRAQDGSTAASFQVGTLVEMRVNAASMTDLVDEHDQAAEITIADVGNYYTSGVVEGALQEVGSTLRTQVTRYNVAALLADTVFTYTAGQPDTVTTGNIIRTRAEGFAYEVAASGATNQHVTTAGGVKLYLLPTSAKELTALAAGATEATDVSAALQLAIDVAIYGLGTTARRGLCPVLADLKSATLGTTLHLGYGDTFKSGFLHGLGKKYLTEVQFSGTALTSTLTAGPAISVQGARGNSIRSLSLKGVAYNTIYAGVAGGNDRTQLNRATWEAYVAAAGATPGQRYAPLAGVAVDPYSGSAPSPAYPTINYPAWSGITTQYNKAFSSDIRLHDLEITGFEVGIVVQPNADGNGDFVEIRDCDVFYCVDGVSVGNTQARNTDLSGCNFARVHTCITNNKHGNRQGRFDSTMTNGHVGGFAAQIFDLTDGSVGGTLTIQNFYAESLGRLGTLSGLSAFPERAVVLRDCKFDMNSNSTDQFVEASLIKGTWSDMPEMVGCIFRVRSVAAIGLGPIELASNLVVPDTPTKAYQALALNCLSGGIVPDPNQNPTFQQLMTAWRVSSPSSTAGNGLTGPGYGITGRDTGIPHAMIEGLCPNGDVPFSNKRKPTSFIGTGSLSAVSRADRSVSVISSDLLIADTDRHYFYGILPGCVWVHRETGTVLFVRSANTGTGEIILEMQNNYYFDGTNWQILDTNFNPATANFYTFNGLAFAPPWGLWGTLTSGSNTITNVYDISGGANVTNWGLQVGDRLAPTLYPYALGGTGNRFGVTAIDTGARTITLSGNMVYTGTIALPFWWQAPPANAASR